MVNLIDVSAPFLYFCMLFFSLRLISTRKNKSSGDNQVAAIPSPPSNLVPLPFPSFQGRIYLHLNPNSVLRQTLYEFLKGLITVFLILLHPLETANLINSFTAWNGRNTGSPPLPFIVSYSNANVLAA